jgi:hypothetical protein
VCGQVIGSRSATEPEIDEPRKRVGVRVAQIAPFERLLAALEQAFPVCFEQAETIDPERFDGALLIGSSVPPIDPSALMTEPGALTDIPVEIPTLMLPAWAVGRNQDLPVSLAESTGLARPLRGATITENSVAGEFPFGVPPSERVLASVGRNPVWWQLGDGEPLFLSAYLPAQLQEGETLREYLRAGCFMALLPLVHFLGTLLDARGWTSPPLRASFVIDDPNLHWPSYGFLKYRQLIDQASRHCYHVGFATVPLDGRLVNPRAAALVRESPSALSLLIHGNDHTARELGRLSDTTAEVAIAQALRRIATLERRSGVAVERVMAPPHGACSEPALRAMFRLGLEAACISRPFPWRDGLPAPTPLAGWHPAEMVGGGLPVLPRYSLSSPREDLVFRALLGQPLILYGHHGDFSKGLDLFAEAAGYVNGLGEVHWGPLSEIARRNYTTRQVGDVLHIGMHARQITVEIPDGVHALNVQIPEPLGGTASHHLTHAGGTSDISFKEGLGTTRLALDEAPTTIELTLLADRPLVPTAVAAPHFRPWPSIRRIAVETRDRIQQLL